MKLIIKKEFIACLFTPNFDLHSKGREVEVDGDDYSRWLKTIADYKLVQRELQEFYQCAAK